MFNCSFEFSTSSELILQLVKRNALNEDLVNYTFTFVVILLVLLLTLRQKSPFSHNLRMKITKTFTLTIHLVIAWGRRLPSFF